MLVLGNFVANSSNVYTTSAIPREWYIPFHSIRAFS